MTNDLQRPYRSTQCGNSRSIYSARLPVSLVYQEDAANRSEALKREYAIKQMSRKQKEKTIGHLDS